MGTNAELAAAVAALLKERGLSLRQAGQLAGLGHVTISNLRRGVTPGVETILKFARGLGVEPNEWLRLAGYAELDADSVNGYGRFVLGLAELCTELGRPIPVSLDMDQAQRMTPAQAEETLAVLRRQAEEGLI